MSFKRFTRLGFLLTAVVLGSASLRAQPAAPPVAAPVVSTPAAVPPSAASVPAAPAPTDLGQPTGGAASYPFQLRELEERVVGLKEEVFQAKTRLLLLQEEIVQNIIAEARAVIIHNNDMGSAFTLERVAYFLDTEQVYVQENRDGQLDEKTRFEIFNGNLVPGNHVLSVEFTYRGSGAVFTYLDRYRVKVSSNYNFFAAKGRITQIEVVGYKKGTAAMDLHKRPSVKFVLTQLDYDKERLRKAGANPGASRPSAR